MNTRIGQIRKQLQLLDNNCNAYYADSRNYGVRYKIYTTTTLTDNDLNKFEDMLKSESNDIIGVNRHKDIWPNCVVIKFNKKAVA